MAGQVLQLAIDLLRLPPHRRLVLVVPAEDVVVYLLDVGELAARVLLQPVPFGAEPVVGGTQILGGFQRGRLRRPVLR